SRSNLLVLSLFNNESLACSVLLPHIATPTEGNVAIGLTLLLYSSPFCFSDSFLLALFAFVTPLFTPPTANQGNFMLSVYAIFLTTSQVGGNHTFVAFSGSLISIHGE